VSSTSPRVSKVLNIAALVVCVATVATWFATGAHLGWTQTTVIEMQHDDVTGIDYPVPHQKFVAGIEVLAIGTGASAGMATLAFLLTRKKPPRS
jgi:hypothetical protein